MRKNEESATHLAYSDGFLIKLAAHTIILGLAMWAFMALPSGGSLIISGFQGQLHHESPLGIVMQRRIFDVGEVSEAVLRSARHSPGSGPRTLAGRIEIHLTSGEILPLTRHYSNRRAEMAAIVRQLNKGLGGPENEMEVAYNDHKPAAFIIGFLGLYALYMILWGIRQTTLRVDRHQGRISLMVRGLIVRRNDAWRFSEISHLALQVKAPRRKRRRVRPVIALQSQVLKPILPAYSSVSDQQFRDMLENIAKFSGIEFRREES